MKLLLILASLSFGATLSAIEPGAMRACNELFNTQDFKEACIGTNASFETINGCTQVEIITKAGDMLTCIQTKAKFETINACNGLGFKTASLVNECIATHSDFVTINKCNKLTKTRNARSIIDCIKSAR